MNKLASMDVLKLYGYHPTDFYIIPRNDLGLIEKIFFPWEEGWVVRSGAPADYSIDAVPEVHAPWNATKPLFEYSSPDEQKQALYSAVIDVFRRAPLGYLAIVTPQRRFYRSFHLLVFPGLVVLETCLGAPFDMQLGRQPPGAVFLYSDLISFYFGKAKQIIINEPNSVPTRGELHQIIQMERDIPYNLMYGTRSSRGIIFHGSFPYPDGRIDVHDVLYA